MTRCSCSVRGERRPTMDMRRRRPTASSTHSRSDRDAAWCVMKTRRELNFSAVCSFLKPMIQFCCSSLCVSRWVLWGSQRTSKVTARSSKCGTMAERRFTSYRYDQASRTTHLTSSYSFHIKMIKNQIITSPRTSGSSSCGFQTSPESFQSFWTHLKCRRPCFSLQPVMNVWGLRFWTTLQIYLVTIWGTQSFRLGITWVDCLHTDAPVTGILHIYFTYAK